MAILTGNMKSCLPHGIFHVHVGHMLDEVMKELCPPVDCQPVDLQQKLLTLFPLQDYRTQMDRMNEMTNS